MKKNKWNILTFLMLLPVFAIGQIPKGHFLDADDSAEKGYKVKPYKQKKEGIYHYAILTELPFENDCKKDLSEKERIDCSENRLNELINEKLSFEIEFKGSVYVYLTVTENAEIQNIKVKSYPQTNEIDNLFREAIEKIEVIPGKYKKKSCQIETLDQFRIRIKRVTNSVINGYTNTIAKHFYQSKKRNNCVSLFYL